MALWTPEYADTALWLDAADSDAMTLDGSAVSVWADKSGNDRDFSGSGASRPTKVDDAIRFDGSDDKLAASSAVVGTTYSLFVAFKPVIENAIGGMISQWAANQQGRWTLIANQNTEGTAQGFLNFYNETQTSGNGSFGACASASITNSNTQVAVICTTGSENFKAYKNGSLVDSCTITDVYQGANTVLGDISSTTTYPYDGDILEVVVVSAVVDATTRQLIEGYLAHKWGMESGLPSDHPYKDDPPTVFVISGVVLDVDGEPVARTVRAYSEISGELVATATSNGSTGAYGMAFFVDDLCTIVASGETDRNALILSGVEPVL